MRAGRLVPAARLTMALRLAVCLAILAGCGGERSPLARCANCGMLVQAESGWRAGATDADGEALAFDTPKCLFRVALAQELRGAWVIEYYGQARADAADLFYVTGTDLVGPMGPDLVPVAGREAAERLRDDHRGTQVLAWGDVDSALVESLF